MGEGPERPDRRLFVKLAGAAVAAGAAGLKVDSAEAQGNSTIYRQRLQRRIVDVSVAIEASYYAAREEASHNAIRDKKPEVDVGITNDEETRLTDMLMPRGDNFAYERQLHGTQRNGEELQRPENSIEDRCQKMRIYLDQIARDTLANK